MPIAPPEQGHRNANSDQATELEQTRLSEREEDILRLLLEGKTNKQIGAALCICEKTVEKHLTQLYRKLRVKSRAEAIICVTAKR